MAAEQYVNDAYSTLATTMNNSVTSVVVATGEGARFPASGDFRIRIDSEIMLCTSRSTDTLTVTRGAESTSAASHTSGVAVEHVMTAASLLAIINGVQVPRARAFNSAAQSIANSTWAGLTFDSESYDTDTIHSTSSNTGRLTCKTAGFYHVTGVTAWASNTAGLRYARFALNGSGLYAHVAMGAASGDVTIATFGDDMVLAVNDYVEIQVFQSSGGALNAAVECAFSMFRVGP